MRNSQLLKYMEKKYWKENQSLDLKTEIEKEDGRYYWQEISCGDYYLCEIQTYDSLYPSEWGSTPYCFKPPWTGFLITVPKFGGLTDEDVHKAIAFCMSQLTRYGIWNVRLDGERIQGRLWNDYTLSAESLHEFKEAVKNHNERSKKEEVVKKSTTKKTRTRKK